MVEGTEAKWEGMAEVELKGSRADQIWPFWADFCNLHKWLPSVDVCYQVDGVLGQPGLVRYCAAGGVDGKEVIGWCKEKLLTFNPTERSLSYEILENTIGFKSYVANIRVLPVEEDGQHECKIQWSFVADPAEGWTLDSLKSYVNSSLQSIAKNMEAALQSQSE